MTPAKILYDLFPARVRVVPATDVAAALAASELNTYTRAFGRAVDKVRVVLTDQHLLIAADADAGPVLIFRERYDRDSLSWPRKNSEQKRLISESGKLVIVEHDPNCGCGSRLRSWNPYRTVMSEQDPS
jgi:hypothetical protein